MCTAIAIYISFASSCIAVVCFLPEPVVAIQMIQFLQPPSEEKVLEMWDKSKHPLYHLDGYSSIVYTERSFMQSNIEFIYSNSTRTCQHYRQLSLIPNSRRTDHLVCTGTDGVALSDSLAVNDALSSLKTRSPSDLS